MIMVIILEVNITGGNTARVLIDIKTQTEWSNFVLSSSNCRFQKGWSPIS